MKSALYKKVTSVIFLIVMMLLYLTSCTFDPATTESVPNHSTPTFSEPVHRPSQGLLYEVNKDGKSCTVVGLGSCADTEVYIPVEHNGYVVTNIGENAFAQCKNITSITIPNSVTNIGDYAFQECWKLTSIEIPDSVTSIGKGAFQRCTSLTRIALPNGLTSIGPYSFRGCYGLTSIGPVGSGADLQIPASVTSMGYDAFSACSYLTSIVLPDQITSIGFAAFSSCVSLESVTIGKNSQLSIIDFEAFWGCTSLTNIAFEGTVEQWNTITKRYGWNDNVPATEVNCKDGTVSL